MSLTEEFNDAAKRLKNFTKRPTDSDILEAYSLYKQATIGDINISKPLEPTALAKWSAWNKKKGITSNKAKEDYIAKVNELAPKFA